MTFRRRLFFSSLAAAAVTLAVATALVSWSVRRTLEDRIQAGLVSEARLAAETLSQRRAAMPEDLDTQADAIGRLISARVTFIAPDGTVVGDSNLTAAELAAVENHADRPEIQQARAEGLGVARRYSETLSIDMLYVAVPVRRPDATGLSEVRLALPLTELRDQLADVRRIALVALVIGLGAAATLTWAFSSLLSRRVRNIATIAERYADGDFSQPARDYGRDEIGTVARVLDDSVREIAKRAAQLASDRARMEAILAGMIEGVLVLNEQGRLQLVNDAARRMLQLPGTVEGRHYLEIVRNPAIADRIAAALAGRAGDGLELSSPFDPDRVFVVRSAPVSSGEFGGAVLVLHDITDLRRADRIRRDFVANVSHELRTPLTAIRGYVEALVDDECDAADARRFLETIARHTRRMERLVADLLRLARLDARQEPLERVRVSIATLYAGVVADLSNLLESRRQEVGIQVEPGAEVVEADTAKLHDALRNLLENASNYAPEHSRIIMRATRTAGALRLTVSDEGPGIPDQELPRIFERFYRVDKARSRGPKDPGGTGLGLAIVKHLVELHGGTVRATNRPEGGAEFAIELPAG